MGAEITKAPETADGMTAKDVAKLVESLVVRGDVSALSPTERARHYVTMCSRLGLDAHTQPFAFLRLNGKEVMYATRGATDQLARLHRINRKIVDGPKVIDVAGTKVVYALCEASMDGRTETATATVPLTDPVNVLMKCETKAKRRATLSILGLGMLDEMELETIPQRSQEPGGGIDLALATERRPAPPARSLPPLEALGIERDTPRIVGEIDGHEVYPPPTAREVLAMAEALSRAPTLEALEALRVEYRPEYERATPEHQALLRSAVKLRMSELTPPPDGTSGPQGPGTSTSAEGTAAEGAPTAMDARAYLGGIDNRRALENAVRKHGKDQGPAWVALAAQRLVAISTPADDGTRLALVCATQAVEVWAHEGPRRKRAA